MQDERFAGNNGDDRMLVRCFDSNSKRSVMKEEKLLRLIQQTFGKLSCPADGHGMYAEIEKAVREAYNMGKAQQEGLHTIKPTEEIQFAFSRA